MKVIQVHFSIIFFCIALHFRVTQTEPGKYI